MVTTGASAGMVTTSTVASAERALPLLVDTALSVTVTTTREDVSAPPRAVTVRVELETPPLTPTPQIELKLGAI